MIPRLFGKGRLIIKRTAGTLQKRLGDGVPLTLSGLLSLQPTSDAPSPWLAIGTFIGLPIALWTYKVNLFLPKLIPLTTTSMILELDVIRIPTENHIYG